MLKKRLCCIYVGVLASLLVLPGASRVAAHESPEQSIAQYQSWQPEWDHNHYDRHHVLLGRVLAYAPEYVKLQRSDGRKQTIALVHGTEMRPKDASPVPGSYVALVGFYHHRHFNVDTVIVR